MGAEPHSKPYGSISDCIHCKGCIFVKKYKALCEYYNSLVLAGVIKVPSDQDIEQWLDEIYMKKDT